MTNNYITIKPCTCGGIPFHFRDGSWWVVKCQQCNKVVSDMDEYECIEEWNNGVCNTRNTT